MSARSRLRTAVDLGEVVFAPLALDALAARIAGEAGLAPLHAIEDETTERTP